MEYEPQPGIRPIHTETYGLELTEHSIHYMLKCILLLVPTVMNKKWLITVCFVGSM